MLRISTLYKLFLPLIVLISFVAVFFLCDSFKIANHAEKQTHTEGHTHHHAIISNTGAVTSTLLLFLIAYVIAVTLFDNAYKFVLSPVIDVVGLRWLYFLLVRKLCNHIFESLRRGLLNPKKYNLSYI